MTEANYDEVICPNCVTQFRAIPVNVQNELRALAAQLETLQYEVDAIPAIKAERDAYEKCADTMAAAHKVERDALKDAARLALDALSEMISIVVIHQKATKNKFALPELEYADKAIAALKAVL